MVKSDADTPDAYLEALPEDRRVALSAVRSEILANLNDGFVETMNWGIDMGNSCVRFKSLDQLPLPLVGEVIKRGSADELVAKAAT